MKLIKACFPWASPLTLIAGAVALIALALCLKVTIPALLGGAVPLLLITACVVPCLAPLALLRRRRQAGSQEPPQES